MLSKCTCFNSSLHFYVLCPSVRTLFSPARTCSIMRLYMWSFLFCVCRPFWLLLLVSLCVCVCVCVALFNYNLFCLCLCVVCRRLFNAINAKTSTCADAGVPLCVYFSLSSTHQIHT